MKFFPQRGALGKCFDHHLAFNDPTLWIVVFKVGLLYIKSVD